MKFEWMPTGALEALEYQIIRGAVLSYSGPIKCVIAQIKAIDPETWESLKRTHVEVRRIAKGSS